MEAALAGIDSKGASLVYRVYDASTSMQLTKASSTLGFHVSRPRSRTSVCSLYGVFGAGALFERLPITARRFLLIFGVVFSHPIAPVFYRRFSRLQRVTRGTPEWPALRCKPGVWNRAKTVYASKRLRRKSTTYDPGRRRSEA